MINFVYGRSAYKKTEKITEMIAQDHKNGVRSFLIVPEQFAVHTERKMLTSLPSSAQLNLEILNFSRLYNRVCREYGGLEYNYITKPMKYAIMWQNLRELAPLLEVYGKYAEQDTSMCDMMISAIGEFKGSGISPAMLESAANKLPSDAPLAQKLRDLALIYASFNNYVVRAFSDSSDDISKLYDTLVSHNFFENSNVYIDSFTSFTAVEYKVIEKMFEQAKNVTVTIPLDFPKKNALYTKSILECESSLSKSAKKHGGHCNIILSDIDENQNADIRYLADNLWIADGKKSNKETNEVHLFKCSSPYTEAEAAATTVLSLLREGYRCRDIVVLARDVEQYRGIIEPAFDRCDIPYYFSEKTDLSSTPIVKFLLSALRIGIYNWRTNDVISHLKYALYDIDTKDVDLFEQYITTWQIRGSKFTAGDFTMNPDGYTDRMTERGEKILEAANKTRSFICTSLTSLFDELNNEESIVGKIQALYRFLVKSGVRQGLERLCEKETKRGNVREAEEYSKLFALCCDALASLAEAMAEDDGMCSNMSLSELHDILSVYFSKTDMGAIPTSADQVIIGSASMMRASSPKCVLMLGLCEGVFPAPINEGGLLSFHERALLADININLSGDVGVVASDELMYVQRAVETPSERLYMFSYTNSADGRKCSPSLPFERAAKIFPDSLKIFDSKDIVSYTPTLRAALQYLDTIKEPHISDALIECAKENDELSSLIDKRAIPISDTLCSVSPNTAEDLFGKTLRLSQSRIDKFVNCNFSYYCTYVLKLRDEQITRFKANDIGTFIHYILEKLLANIVKENGINTTLPEDTIKDMTRTVVDEYISRITPPGQPITARLGHLYNRLYNLSLLLVCNIIEEFRHSLFRPEFFELETNGKGENPSAREFELSDGRKIVFSGIIDRVDILRLEDGKVYIRVVDYKTGTKQFSIEDIKHGLNVQMLLYLFALTNNKNEKFNERIGSDSPDAAGVVYLSSNAPTLDLTDYEDAKNVFDKAQKQLNRSGLFLEDEEILRAMNDTISPDFLGGIRKKADGTLSGKGLATPEMFEKIKHDIDRVICRIADEMLSGNANALPLVYNKKDPCEFCEMKPICRINKQKGDK